MFVPKGAAEYRALDHDAFEARRQEVIDVLNSETLPEGITTDQLIAERDIILEEVRRRNAEIELRNATITSLLNGNGKKVVDTFTPEPAKKNVRVDAHDTEQYRNAFMEYVRTGFMAPELRADGAGSGTVTDISINGAYTSSTDVQIYVPTTIANRIIQKLEERGEIWNRVQKTYVKGGVQYNVFDFKPEAFWITQKKVSPYQMDEENEYITFVFHELECRIAQTLLSAAVTFEAFQERFSEAVADAMIDALEASIVSGTGTGEMLGFTKDPRITNKAYLDNTEVANWVAWHTNVKAAIPRPYRRRGEFIIGQGTWDKYIETLRDKDDHPVSQTGYNPVTGAEEYRLMGLPVSVVPDSVMPDFDTASDGDVIAAFGNLNDYVVNIQPGMPLSVVRWVDHDNNLVKTKALMACDGRVVDPYGFVLIIKGAADSE